MIIKIKIPSPGESINEVELAAWHVKDGDHVSKDQEVAEIESDKATLPLLAEEAGEIKILIKEGSTAKPGDIACEIDTEKEGVMSEEQGAKSKEHGAKSMEQVAKSEEKEEAVPKSDADIKVTPVAKAMMEENGLNLEDILKGLKRISSREVEMVLKNKESKSVQPIKENYSNKERIEERNRMSQLRKKLSKRLVAVKNETAMLTTFNEVDMHRIIALRKTYNDRFVEKYGFKLGFMSFFTKAAAKALEHFPMGNSYINGD